MDLPTAVRIVTGVCYGAGIFRDLKVLDPAYEEMRTEHTRQTELRAGRMPDKRRDMTYKLTPRRC